MARYIDADALLKKIFTYTINAKEVEYAILSAPAEDVVPKDELLRCRENLKAVLDEIPETQREVAREIFEEIEKLHLHIANEFDARRYAELKKKYTGE
jgi:hypothetical protein